MYIIRILCVCTTVCYYSLETINILNIISLDLFTLLFGMNKFVIYTLYNYAISTLDIIFNWLVTQFKCN